MTESKRALVVGLGVTGQSCIRFLLAQGYQVTGVDSRAQPPKLDELRREFPRLPLYSGSLDPKLFVDPGLLVVSPGLGLNQPVIAQAITGGIEAVGDIELFARVARAPVLAVTGSNGKSTVTSLVGAMCLAAGWRTAVGGNLGMPALDLLADPVPDVYVLELSSFQLETTASLNARAAAVLNITPDHMDRYGSLEEYAAAKARIFRGDGAMALNADDPVVRELARPERQVIYFGLDKPRRPIDFGLRTRTDEIWLARGDELLIPARDVPLPGKHNLANALAAMAVATAAGVPREAQCRALRGFRGLPHRTEIVAQCDGILWINDSKGTNVGATVAALSGMTRPVVLIAGGDGKGADFAGLRAVAAQHARAVVLIGRDAPRIAAALGDAVPVWHAGDMQDAVRQAQRLAHDGDVVLLSPACASFDMFRNYEHRGEVFRAAVKELLK